MVILYPTPQDALSVYAKTIAVSGGGASGFIGDGEARFRSVLDFIRDDTYYPTFEEKLTHLFFSLCRGHFFLDGNKRIAITLCTHMLLLNGYVYCAGRFMAKMENICRHVAAGAIGKDLLYEIVVNTVNEEFDDEELKLRIIDAIDTPQAEPFRLKRTSSIHGEEASS